MNKHAMQYTSPFFILACIWFGLWLADALPRWLLFFDGWLNLLPGTVLMALGLGVGSSTSRGNPGHG